MLLLLKNAFAPNLHQATCKLLFILNILVRMERSELWLNGKSLGCIKLDKDFYGTLSPAQTQALLAALRRHSRIVLTSGKHR